MSRDLMYKDEIQEQVVDAYRALSSPDGPGTRFYADDQVADLPSTSRDWSLGVGNPLTEAAIAPGEQVVDLGCGAGIDTLLAAAAVGADGRAVGVDILPEMVARATMAAGEAGFDNTGFVVGEMESLPLADSSADVVISNGAVNLSARKSRVLAEALRVLRPGGRLHVSDLTIDEDELPPEVITHPSAWAG